MTQSLPILFASHDGHTRLIVTRLAERLLALGVEASPIDLKYSVPEKQELKQAHMIVVAAPIRYGWHLPAVERFVRKNKGWLRGHHLAIISVNLTARKLGKDTPETNPYLRKWVKRHRFTPTVQAVFAGRLEYRIYNGWEKFLIRLIMWITGGPTNYQAVVDYTAWDKVEVLAQQIAAECRKKEVAG